MVDGATPSCRRRADREQLTVGWLVGWLVGGDVAVAAQSADDDRGESLAARGAAALAVEDPGDRRVVVVDREPRDQFDRVLVGADARLVARQRNGELGDRAAAPAKRDRRAALFAVDVEDDFLDQARRSCLRSRSVVVGADHTRPRSAPSASSCSRSAAVSVRGRWCSRSSARPRRRERAERVLPVAFKPAGDQPVLGLDLAVAALGAVGVVSGALDLQPPLHERGVVVGLERLGRDERGLHAGGGERCQQRAGDRLVDLRAADAHAPRPRPSTSSLPGQ